MKRGFNILLVSLVASAVLFALALAHPSPVVASSQYPDGSYWYAEFFDARWPTASPVYTRYDAAINFDWGTGSPNVAVPVDDFSARWTRTVEFAGGRYNIWVVHDDGVLVWIDDQLIINQWYDQPVYMRYTAGPAAINLHHEQVDLAPGPHRIKLEYYEHGKDAVIKFGWSTVETVPSSFVPPPSSTRVEQSVHVVRAGEWLYQIARDYNVSVGDIVEANGLTSMQVRPGQELIIPASDGTMTEIDPAEPATTTTSTSEGTCRVTYTVRSGDNLFRIALSYDVSVAGIAANNSLKAPYTIHVGQELCVP
jgi:LysM repeat protein